MAKQKQEGCRIASYWDFGQIEDTRSSKMKGI